MTTVPFHTPLEHTTVRPRPTGFIQDTVSIAGRALRAVPKDVSTVIPPVLIAFFFFIVNVATLKNLTQGSIAHFDYTAFQMATAILLGVTGVSRAPALVVDVQDGYLDRLLLTPVRRLSILIGHMVADVVVAAALTLPILALGYFLGVRFATGLLGVVVFIGIAAAWSLAFAAFGYAIALKTGNPAAVQSSFLLFFPFLFLTSAYVPRDQLTPWLQHVAAWNPVTYILQGLRSLAMTGWNALDLVFAALAIAIVALVSMAMCFKALDSRVKQK